MATEINMPRLGWTMEEGTLVQWLKNDGDTVQVGDLILVIEGDKATSEVEAFEEGILHIPATSPAPGVTVPVGTLMGYILKPGEAAPNSGAAPAAAAPAAEPAAPAAAPVSGPGVTEINMPRLGWTMEEGTLVQWLKNDGDSVEAGDLILVVEGDKAASEVESFESGILRIPANSPAPGTVVPVGTLLGYILAPGAQMPSASSATAAATSSSTPSAAPASNPAPSANNQRQGKGPAISPRARRIAKELGVDYSNIQGSGRTGRIVERDIRAAAATQNAPVRVTPVARNVAENLGVDINQLASEAAGRRIGRADVEQAARSSQAAPAAPAAASLDTSNATPLSGIRKISAARLTESARTVVPVTLTTDVDATALVNLRKEIAGELKAAGLPVPTYNDMILKVVSVALSEHPALNSSLVEAGIIQHQNINIGFAVDTDRGLLVPVVRDADSRSLQNIAAETTRLIDLTRKGKAQMNELSGGTFTISNLGMFNIDAFTPVINLPESAILGVGRIQARPVVVDEDNDTIEVRRMLALSLTFDHRVVDGAPAARFLNRIRKLIERPYLWLTR
jgi:pyruvate dehydrogenase E2 component (dihydrolipoamide acetyltransferase)